MKWYKHDSNANTDAKLKRVRMKYGMEGYGLYWYCLELICEGIESQNLTFELEHDSEIIAHDTGIHYERVQEMMAYMVNLELFEMNQGVITCMKMAKRLDLSMTSKPKYRKQLREVISNSHDRVMTGSKGGHELEKKRKEKNLKDMSEVKTSDDSLFEELWQTFPVGFGAKGSKKKALAQFNKVSLKDYPFLLSGLKSQTSAKRVAKVAGEFAENFPHVERWLRDERFKDDVVVSPQHKLENRF